jgi:hypothetical protein
MKSAQSLLQQLTSYLMPLPGTTIEISEIPSQEAYDENWRASGDGMDETQVRLFGEMVGELRRSDRIIDWSGVPGPSGNRRLAGPTIR